jgi:pimeloyl-ACP methyl ester carboxylesterase
MSFVSVNGEQIHYVHSGARGVPVVFVHGSGGSHLVWGAQVRAVGEIARAFALDLPGHGKSEGAGRDSIAAYRDRVVGFLDALELDRAVIVGHSLGGAIAQTLALSHPLRVAGLALVGTGARLRVLPKILEGVLSDFESTARFVAQAMFAQPDDPQRPRTEEQLRACAPQVVHGDFSACNAFDVIARLGEIRAPTLVLCGRADVMTPVKYGEFLAAKIAGAQLVVVENAGHALMLEQAVEVNRALVEFIRKL